MTLKEKKTTEKGFTLINKLFWTFRTFWTHLNLIEMKIK